MSRDHRLRQALRHRLPVALHEDEGDHRLQQDHRRDDDDQRARIEPLRHVARDEPPVPVPVLGQRDADRQFREAVECRPIGNPRPRAAHRLGEPCRCEGSRQPPGKRWSFMARIGSRHAVLSCCRRHRCVASDTGHSIPRSADTQYRARSAARPGSTDRARSCGAAG